MDTLFQKIKEEALLWQANGYKNTQYPAIGEILSYNREESTEK